MDINHLLKASKLDDFERMTEKEELSKELIMSNYINSMDPELKDRFKALKILMDEASKYDQNLQFETRKLELEFEKKYNQVYDMRTRFVNGEKGIEGLDQKQLVREWDKKAELLKD